MSLIGKSRPSNRKMSRRAAVIAQTAISLSVLVGFSALAVDVGAMYNTKAELQRTADAAAMAAAAQLGDQTGDPQARARSAAQSYANVNTVLKSPLLFDTSDFTFGTAAISANGNSKYVFTPTTVKPNAVRVTARRTTSSPSGAMPLFFARIFGKQSANITAQAAAVLTPRDICFVLDLSLSHSFDSSLIHYRLTDVGPGMKSVWQFMNPSSTVGNLAAAGPTFGNMNTWGTDTVDSGWNYASDSGLTQLKRGTGWTLTSAWASQSLAAWQATQSATVKAQHPATYTSAEMSVINSATGAGTETSTSNSTQLASYRRRVRVALGIDRWNSGKTGGQQGGNGDNVIDANEVTSLITYPSTGTKQFGTSSGSWDEFVDYVADTSKADNLSGNTDLTYRFMKYDPSSTCYGNPLLRWRFGLKTMTDYLQMQHYMNSDSPGFSGGPQQPMGSVADGVKTAVSYIKSLNGNDQVGMVGYGQIGYGPGDSLTPNALSWLTTDFDGVIAKVNLLQSAIWSGNTNIPQGIDKAAGGGPFNYQGVLSDTAQNHRDNATKIIFLLTDGRANIVRNGTLSSSQNTSQSLTDTLAAATDAVASKSYRKNGCLIYTVSVGADADTSLMSQVAAIGKGQSFTAAGNVAAYQAQLQNIFLNLGGKRPVALIE